MPFYTPIENSTSDSRNAQASRHLVQKFVQSRTAGHQEHGGWDSPSADGPVLQASHSGNWGEPGGDDGGARGGGGPYGDGDSSESVRASTDESLSPGDDESEGAMAVDEAGERSSPRKGPELAACIVGSMANVDADAQLGPPSRISHPNQDVDSDASS